jgi:hypothetical protein
MLITMAERTPNDALAITARQCPLSDLRHAKGHQGHMLGRPSVWPYYDTPFWKTTARAALW